jgi:hypothetical protein
MPLHPKAREFAKSGLFARHSSFKICMSGSIENTKGMVMLMEWIVAEGPRHWLQYQ